MNFIKPTKPNERKKFAVSQREQGMLGKEVFMCQ